ncbi:hypothetical protein ACKC9G_11675 [Pokkaliibacter sp. CJK22405]|uniref:hypothetical protein n=1 Tax=Pokkaliibacter sp. CJK22405 TaxID=3384615 RepID=UPI0039847049
MSESFSALIAQVKAGQSTVESLFAPFLGYEFFVLVEMDDAKQEVTTEDFQFYIIEMHDQPMVVVGDSMDRLGDVFAGNNQLSAIKVFGGDLLGMIHPDVGVCIVWEEGNIHFPVELTQQLRAAIQAADAEPSAEEQ